MCKILFLSNNDLTISQFSQILGNLHILESIDNRLKILSKIKDFKPELIFIDNVWPLGDYPDLISSIRKSEHLLPIIFLNMPKEIKEAVAVMKLGANTVFSKPLEKEKVLREIEEILKIKLERKIFLKIPAGFPWFLGSSLRIQKFISDLEKAAEFKSHLIFIGSLGNHKKEIAQIIHRNSFYSHQHFICFNFYETLGAKEFYNKFEAYLQQDGKLLLAPATIYLEGLNFEKKETVKFILKILEKSQEELYRNYRFIIGVAKKNTPDVEFERLEFSKIYVPSLQERREDIPFLITELVETFNSKFGKNIRHISTEVLDFFINYSFDGETQEMDCLVKAAMVAIPPNEEIISLKDIPINFEMFLDKIGEKLLLQRNFELRGAILEYHRELEKFLEEKIKQDFLGNALL